MSSLADNDRLAGVLTDAGLGEIEIDPVAPEITLGGGGDIDETVAFLLGTGIARALFDGAPPAARCRPIGAVTDALREFYEPGRGVVLGTRCLARDCRVASVTVNGPPGLVSAAQIGSPRSRSVQAGMLTL